MANADTASDSIRAELARRRMTVGRLSATTGISYTTLQRRLANPETFRLPELASIAIALDVSLDILIAPYLSGVGA